MACLLDGPFRFGGGAEFELLASWIWIGSDFVGGRWGKSSSIARCRIVKDGNGGRISEAEKLKKKKKTM